jgi:ubiquinone/menaquinone biosynthesis C-methylase UbiE
MAGSHPGPDRFATSTGQAVADVTWVDAHFEACRPEYEAMLRSVGLQPGWHVLDAGTGSGLFLPSMAELVGPSGRLTALDVAPENVAAVRERVSSWSLPCPVEAKVGSITALPYPDDHFDAVWCAATTQYLDDQELATTLGEFGRVVRPDGLVAIKDYDAALERIRPADPALRWHLLEALQRSDHPQAQLVRGWL